MKRKIIVLLLVITIVFNNFNIVNANTYIAEPTKPINEQIIEKVALTIAMAIGANFSDITNYDNYVGILREEFPKYWENASTTVKNGIDIATTTVTNVHGATVDWIVDIVAKILYRAHEETVSVNNGVATYLSQGHNHLYHNIQIAYLNDSGKYKNLYIVEEMTDGSIKVTSNRSTIRLQGEQKGNRLQIHAMRGFNSVSDNIFIGYLELKENWTVAEFIESIANTIEFDSPTSITAFFDALPRYSNVVSIPKFTVHLANPNTWDEGFNDWLNGLSINGQPYVPGQDMSLNIPRTPNNTFTGRVRGATDIPDGTIIEYDPTSDRVLDRETGRDITDVINTQNPPIEWDLPGVRAGDVPNTGTITNPYTGEVTDISTGEIVRVEDPTIPYESDIPNETDIPNDPPYPNDPPEVNKHVNRWMQLVTTKFPFSLPWDLLFLFSLLNVEPQTPHFVVDVGVIQFEHKMDYLDPYIGFFRAFLVIGFCFSLVLATRKLLGGSV